MFGLGQIQVENLLAEIRSGHIRPDQLCALGPTVCTYKSEGRRFRYTTRVVCATEEGAEKLLAILRRG